MIRLKTVIDYIQCLVRHCESMLSSYDDAQLSNAQAMAM